MSYNRQKNKYCGQIYLIINKINNKKYVGQTTVNISSRWSQHINNKSDNAQLIDRVIRKYGKDSFSIEELGIYECDTLKDLKEILDEKEKYYINRFSSLASEWGYNIETGGTYNTALPKFVDVYHVNGKLLNKSISKDEAARIYNVHPDTIRKIYSGAKKNLSETYVFRREDEPLDKYEYKTKHFKEIYKWELTGELSDIYYSRREAIDNGAPGFFASKLDDIYATAGGYWWSTTNEFKYIGEQINNHEWKKVYLYDLYGKLIEIFRNIASVAYFLNVSRESVKNNLNNCSEYLSINGYLCRYENVEYNYGLSEEMINNEIERLAVD